MESTKIEPLTLSYFENTEKRIIRHTEKLEFNRMGDLLLGYERKSITKEKRLKFWTGKTGKKHYFNFNDLHRVPYHRQVNRKCGILLKDIATDKPATMGEPTGQWKSVYEM
jgi:hypothetical protein